MRDATISRNYARALVDLGRAHGEADSYAAAFAALAEVLGQDAQVRRFLETPKIDVTTKQKVVGEALRDRVPELFLRFVLVTIAKNRQRLLREIQVEYENILDQEAGRLHAQVTVAREPDPEMVRVLGERLSEMLGKEVVPHVTVNPEILGGLIVRYGDRCLDGSLRRQLLSLKREMLNATLPELPARSA